MGKLLFARHTSNGIAPLTTLTFCLYLLLGVCLPMAQAERPEFKLAKQGEADVLVAQAVLAYDNQQYQKALDLLKQAEELDPHDPRGLYYLGLTHQALKQPNQAIPPLEAVRQLRPNDEDVAYQLGVAYFSAGKYDEATPVLEEVYQKNPDTENLGYYVGLNRYRQKEYTQAVEAFDSSKTSDPNIQQLTSFYRGLALGVLGLSEQAQAELKTAQQTQAVSPITGSAQRAQEALADRQAATEAKRFRAQLSLGGYYDDNVAINPDPATIANDPGNQQAILDSLRRRHTSTPGFLASLLADYSFYRDGPMEATLTYSFFQTLNGNSLNDFNIQDHLVGVSGFYRGLVAEIPYQLGLQYTFDYLFLDMDGFLMRHTPTVNLTLVPPSFDLPLVGTVGNLSNALYRYQVKEFFREPSNSDPRFGSESRDAFNNMLGFLHAFRFNEDKFIIRIGYQYDNESADGAAFSYNGNRLLTGGQLSLPIGEMVLRYDYDIHWRDYKNNQVLFTDRAGTFASRYDAQHTHLIQLIKPLPWNLRLTGQVQIVRNQSSIPVYDYSKNVFTGLVTWTY